MPDIQGACLVVGWSRTGILACLCGARGGEEVRQECPTYGEPVWWGAGVVRAFLPVFAEPEGERGQAGMPDIRGACLVGGWSRTGIPACLCGARGGERSGRSARHTGSLFGGVLE